MELNNAKYISMIVLFVSNIVMTLIGIFLQRYVHSRNENTLLITQRIISCLTSGILLGVLLMLILPNSLDAIANHQHNINLGFCLIGLGFFLICFIEESMHIYEKYMTNKYIKTENEKLVNPLKGLNQDGQLTRLITIVFALGVHYFFSGIVIGAHTKSVATLWILLGAICFHMSLIAFSVTLRLLTDNQNYIRVFIGMSIWSIMGPLGILTSLLVSLNTSEMHLVNGILQCLSTGTFFYITFIDMIHSDLTKTKLYPFINVTLMFVGFIIIFLTGLEHKHFH